jgi:CCR4-NOT transcription complex subunit 1
MLTILCDFIAAVVYVSDDSESAPVFDRLYRAILRFILFLAHDFPDFLANSAPEIVVLIPTLFSQLRNIILSVSPSSIIIPVTAIPFLDVPGIDIFTGLQQPLRMLVDQLGFAEIIRSGEFPLEVVTQLMRPGRNGCLTSFMVFLANSTVPQTTAAQILSSVENLHGFVIIVQLLEKTNGNPDSILAVVNALVDQLRFPSRATLFFMRVLLTLFKMERGKSVSGLELNELILRAVMERAVTPRPHPWGLQMFVREVIENPEYGLWSCPFVVNSQVIQTFLTATSTAFGVNKV